MTNLSSVQSDLSIHSGATRSTEGSTRPSTAGSAHAPSTPTTTTATSALGTATTAAVDAATTTETATTPVTPNAASRVASNISSGISSGISDVGSGMAEAASGVASGVTRMVDWTAQTAESVGISSPKSDGYTHSRGLRPMHVRVSVRIHHVAFLHPGLDSGAGASVSGNGIGQLKSPIGGRSSGFSKWKKNKNREKPGLLKFGSKKGDWKLPNNSNHSSHPAGTVGGGGGGAEDVSESELSEIITAETFRLSRDGIIQQHYALNHPPHQQSQQHSANQIQSIAKPDVLKRRKQSITLTPPLQQLNPNSEAVRYYKECAQRPKGYRRLVVSSAMPTDHAQIPAPPLTKQVYNFATTNVGNMANVGSSVTSNVANVATNAATNVTTGGRGSKQAKLSPSTQQQRSMPNGRNVWDFEVPNSSSRRKRNSSKDTTKGYRASYNSAMNSMRNVQLDSSRKDATTKGYHDYIQQQKPPTSSTRQKNDPNYTNSSKFNNNHEHSFNHIEYQYIGPPQTGPDFFQLLRLYGGATFGRYLPEVSCSVPKHSIAFELRKTSSNPLKYRIPSATTQPIVVEAPHIIWGDARDTILSRIAREGCPLIDAREFEYVSNSNLNEAEGSESLLVCGATVWVENAPEGDNDASNKSSGGKHGKDGKGDKRRTFGSGGHDKFGALGGVNHHATKGMVKAEYYGGKIADGVKEGIAVGVKGVKLGTKEAVHGLEKVGKKIVPVHAHHHHYGKEEDGELSVASSRGDDREDQQLQHPRRSKVRSLLNPKHVGGKVGKVFKKKRRSKAENANDNRSIDGSIASELGDDASIASGVSVGSESFATATHTEAMTDAVTEIVAEGGVTDMINENGQHGRESAVASAATDAVGIPDLESVTREHAVNVRNSQTVDGGVADNKNSQEFDHKSPRTPTTLKQKQYHTNTNQQPIPPPKEENKYTIVKPTPYTLILDNVITIQIVSFPDKEPLAKFPISVASVMVQRSMEDRLKDPLQPSELTATLIQEPNAQELRWGVELKVTVRVVEVKPDVPRVLGAGGISGVESLAMGMEHEVNKLKDKLKRLGKSEEEVRKEVEEKEDELLEREMELDNAIVAAGFGRGEDDGAGLEQVRLRQMFYDEREQKSIVRKFRRRQLVTSYEQTMINDAKIDPSTEKQEYNEEEIQQLLNIHFPGVDRGSASFVGSEVVSTVRKSLSVEDVLPPIDEHDATTSDKPVETKGAGLSVVNESVASISLALAESLDSCLGEYVDAPTVPAVQQRVNQILRRGASSDRNLRPALTMILSKRWCSDVAKKLSACAEGFSVGATGTSGADLKPALVQLQNIITASTANFGAPSDDGTPESGSFLPESIPNFGLEGSSDSSKRKENEKTELSQNQSAHSEASALDASKLYDWCTEVASKLEACATEIETVDYDESEVSSSFHTTQSDLGSSDVTKSAAVVAGKKPTVDDADLELFLASAPWMKRRASAGSTTASSVENEASNSSRPLGSISTFKETKETPSWNLRRQDTSDSLNSVALWKQSNTNKVYKSRRSSFSNNTERMPLTTLVSTLDGSNPFANSAPSTVVAPLMKSMKESHFKLHHSSSSKGNKDNNNRALSLALQQMKEGSSLGGKDDNSSDRGLMNKRSIQERPNSLSDKKVARGWTRILLLTMSYMLLVATVFLLGVLFASKYLVPV